MRICLPLQLVDGDSALEAVLSGGDCPIGTSVIDLEDRWFSKDWRERLGPRKPVERRALWHARAPRIGKRSGIQKAPSGCISKS